jgi:hypothetical protein
LPLDPSKKPRNSFHWAVCIPSSCTAKDLEVSLDATLQSLRRRHAVNLEVSVADELCTVAEREPIVKADVFIMYGKIGMFFC